VNISELENRFSHHPPRGDQLARYAAIRSACLQLAITISAHCPPSRERNQAIDAIEDAMFGANASIARHEHWTVEPNETLQRNQEDVAEKGPEFPRERESSLAGRPMTIMEQEARKMHAANQRQAGGYIPRMAIDESLIGLGQTAGNTAGPSPITTSYL